MDKWVGVNVDDRVPSYNYGPDFRPYFTGASQSGAWWMPLMEKAYAKIHMNYDRIVAGSGIEGLRALTGMPVRNFGH